MRCASQACSGRPGHLNRRLVNIPAVLARPSLQRYYKDSVVSCVVPQKVPLRAQEDRKPRRSMAAVKVRYSRQEECTIQAESPTLVPGLTMTAYTMKVPLNYAMPEGQTVTIFFRIVNDIQRAGAEKLPWLLFLQGGPGADGPRPTESSGWLQKAVQYFHVVLLDQRGTGRSTPITLFNIQHLGHPQSQADYLQHFRADNIVRDSEEIRRTLLGPDQRWSILGQSFGGFCGVRYLSAAPEGLSEAFLTGGIPPGINLPCSADMAYHSLFRRVITQNKKYYSRFPQDVAVVQQLVLYLNSLPGGGVPLPRGGMLTPRGMQLLGLAGLGSAGGFERLHFLLERTFDGPSLSYNFLLTFESWMPWGVTPLYAVLHESIYCQGAASHWAAERVRETHYKDAFDAVKSAQSDLPVLFTGEMVFPWMFDEFAELKPFKEVAHLLAHKEDWPNLYDIESLKGNDVPVAAACYYEDMYVDFTLAEDTASFIGSLRQWVTNEYMHSGIREDGIRILDRLMGMTRNSRPLN